MLTTNTITDPHTVKREARLEEIGRAIRMPFGVEKLQAIAALWMSDPVHGQENRWQFAACAHQAKTTRETRLNDFGTSGDKNSALRGQFSPPAGLIQAIEVFCGDENWGGVNGRRSWGIFKRSFPMFNAAQRY